jgi:hypothetical protein
VELVGAGEFPHAFAKVSEQRGLLSFLLFSAKDCLCQLTLCDGSPYLHLHHKKKTKAMYTKSVPHWWRFARDETDKFDFCFSFVVTKHTQRVARTGQMYAYSGFHRLANDEPYSGTYSELVYLLGAFYCVRYTHRGRRCLGSLLRVAEEIAISP